jgi:hypothetical protein
MMDDRNTIIAEIEQELEGAIITLDDLDSVQVRNVGAVASQVAALLNTVQYRLRFLRDASDGVGSTDAALNPQTKDSPPNPPDEWDEGWHEQA